MWQKASSFSVKGLFLESLECFTSSSALFFNLSGKYAKIGRALLEYSILMEALAKVQEGRIAKRNFDYEASLQIFGKASELLRATIHFGYLAPYVSACATLEVASEFELRDEEYFQSYKNAIALLEQSKIALNIRDDKHPLMMKVEMMLKFSIAQALRAEGESLGLKGENKKAERKYAQYLVVNYEYIELASRCESNPDEIDYFPINDCDRVLNGAFVTSYPSAENLSLVNIGCNIAEVTRVGKLDSSFDIDSGDSVDIPMRELAKGRLRVGYMDKAIGTIYDEGCITLI
ncbi:MAG: hypothetical protein ACYC7D_09200 [Nitrososphaerales archaeon]